MITKNDCLMLLAELSEQGIDTTDYVRKVLKNVNIDLEVITFINKNRPLDLSLFYEELRKKYNDKKSKLYKEIVQSDEKEPKDILVTLSSLLTQILLYSKKIENKQLFLRHSRADEISKVLANYFINYNFELPIKLLTLIKADLKACELVKVK